MNENFEHEKLLPNPFNEELLPSGETAPRLSAKEFIKTTPTHELNDIFGILPEKFFAPSISTSPTTKPVTESNSSLTPGQKPKLLKKFARGLAILILIIFILVVALYIWGYFLKN